MMRIGLSTNKLLALDWDRNTLRMVLVRPRADGVDLLRAVSVGIPSRVQMDDAASLGAFVGEAIAETRVSAKKAILAISREHVVLNNLTIPPTPPEEMPAIVQFQVVKELPFPAEQATLDFAVTGAYDAKSPCAVLVAAVRNEDLAFHRAVAEHAGLSVERIGLRPFANLIAVTAKAPELGDKTLLIVEVGPQLTEIDIVRQGQMMFSRAATVVLPQGEAADAEAVKDSRIVTMRTHEREDDAATREAVNELMVEIVRSVEAYRATDPAVGLDHIVVCGATGVESHLVQALAARYATQAELFTPDRAMALTPQRARELRGFNAALGLAIGHGRRGLSFIDFLHPKKPISRRTLRLRKLPMAVATAVLFLGSAVTFHFRFVAPRQSEVSELKRQVADLKKKEEPVLRFKEQVEALENWVEAERNWPEVLAAVTEVFPPETEGYVNRADFDMVQNAKSNTRDAVARLRFRTVSFGTVNELVGKLRAAGFGTVAAGKEIPSQSSRDSCRFDTSIDAMVPRRAPAEAESIPAIPKAMEPAPTNGAAASEEATKPDVRKVDPMEDAARPTSRSAGA